MFMDTAKADLRKLLAYLATQSATFELWPKRYHKIKLVWVKAQDKANLKNPRAFCFTQRGDLSIYCARALNELPVEARLGVLLHEIGHIVMDAFDGDECEVTADQFGFGIAEAGYKYKDVEYVNPLTHELARANSLETVSPQFVEKINAGAS